MKILDFINNKIFGKIDKLIETYPLKFWGIFIFIFSLFCFINGKNDNNWWIGIAIGLFIFISTFIWSWIIGIALFEGYLLNCFIDDLNHSLFGNAFVKIIIIYYAFGFLKFLFPFAEKIVLTKKIFYIFFSIILFLIGFIYNYFILNGSFLSGIEGGSAFLGSILMLGIFGFFIGKITPVTKNK